MARILPVKATLVVNDRQKAQMWQHLSKFPDIGKSRILEDCLELQSCLRPVSHQIQR